eukprot:m.97668 g.97668  ORF g.97668 m.97668 type:complete len:79 (+) comp15230_c1_seq2:164-400(+)
MLINDTANADFFCSCSDFIAPDEEEEFDARYLEQFDQMEGNGGFKARLSFVSQEIAALDPSFLHDPSEPPSPDTPTDY